MRALTLELDKRRKYRNALYMRLAWEALEHDADWDDYVDVQICNGVLKIVSTNDEFVENLKNTLAEMFD